MALLSAHYVPNTTLSTLQQISMSDPKAYVLVTRLYFPSSPWKTGVYSLLSPKCPAVPAI